MVALNFQSNVVPLQYSLQEFQIMNQEKQPAQHRLILESLCRRAEESFGRPVSTPSGFDALADSIFERTSVILSSTTLKRLWGYLDEQVIPRRSTLDTVARYAGWPDYASFANGDHPEIESGSVGSKKIRVDRDINPGERIKLYWLPNRVCLIEYLGESRWRVVSSEGTRLAPEDTFVCSLIIDGEPLYLDDLCHQGTRPGTYVCGRKSGITFSRNE